MISVCVDANVFSLWSPSDSQRSECVMCLKEIGKMAVVARSQQTPVTQLRCHEGRMLLAWAAMRHRMSGCLVVIRSLWVGRKSDTRLESRSWMDLENGNHDECLPRRCTQGGVVEGNGKAVGWRELRNAGVFQIFDV